MKTTRIILAIVLVALVSTISIAVVSAQGSDRPDTAGLQAHGIRLENITTPPAMPMAQGILHAQNWLGPEITSQATQVKAYYVLFSDDNYYRTDSAGKKQFYYQRVPVWLVVFKGVNIPSNAPRTANGNVAVNHELNVVINARTGEQMEMLTYR